MKEYQIEVTTVTTVYIEADSEGEALAKAHEEALLSMPDRSDAKVICATEIEE